MKHLNLLIDHCGDCPYCWGDHYENLYACTETDKLIAYMERGHGQRLEIPEWCPLPNKGEEQ